jgi:hypothetical protein
MQPLHQQQAACKATALSLPHTGFNPVVFYAMAVLVSALFGLFQHLLIPVYIN